MRLSDKDLKFVKDWGVKRKGKWQYGLGVVVQIVLFAITYKVAVTYVTTAMFGPDDLLQYGILGLVLGILIALVKFRRNEKRFKKLTH